VAPQGKSVDAATVEVVRNYLISVAEEMRVTLIRTAFNPVIYEVLDFGISVYDARLELVAEAPGVTRFVGANDYAIRKGIDYLGVENLEPGDVVVLNYPYWNSAHTYDATVFSGVFPPGADRPAGYLVVRAHWLDLGAKDPGYVLDSTDMHQEGLIFPGTKVVKAGSPDRQILELIRFNSRMPDAVLGDLNAQIAAIRTGERRLLELIAKFGQETVDSCVEAILDHGERTARRELAKFPEGTWVASDWIDGDGISDDPIRLQVRVTIGEGGFEVDWDGSAPATRGPVNMPFGSTISTCRMAFKALTCPHEPTNAGQMRPLRVRAEPGTLMHAVYPAPTFTLWTGMVALELIFKALAQGVPERLAASSGGEVPGYMMVGIHPETRRLFAVSNGEAIGWGAAPDHDGSDILNHLCQTVVRNTPIEVMEAKTTMFFERAEVVTDSGGPGRFRGGVGLRRDIGFLGPGEVVTVSKKTTSPPWALEGGCPSTPNTLIAYADSSRERRVSTERIRVEPGDRFRVMGAGGGGRGDPRTRDPAAVREDVIEGFVSAEAAGAIYGVDTETWTRLPGGEQSDTPAAAG
jgi:N-methylhydantoinase B